MSEILQIFNSNGGTGSEFVSNFLPNLRKPSEKSVKNLGILFTKSNGKLGHCFMPKIDLTTDPAKLGGLSSRRKQRAALEKPKPFVSARKH